MANTIFLHSLKALISTQNSMEVSGRCYWIGAVKAACGSGKPATKPSPSMLGNQLTASAQCKRLHPWGVLAGTWRQQARHAVPEPLCCCGKHAVEVMSFVKSTLCVLVCERRFLGKEAADSDADRLCGGCGWPLSCGVRTDGASPCSRRRQSLAGQQVLLRRGL